jgi:hypothetical protein
MADRWEKESEEEYVDTQDENNENAFEGCRNLEYLAGQSRASDEAADAEVAEINAQDEETKEDILDIEINLDDVNLLPESLFHYFYRWVITHIPSLCVPNNNIELPK